MFLFVLISNIPLESARPFLISFYYTRVTSNHLALLLLLSFFLFFSFLDVLRKVIEFSGADEAWLHLPPRRSRTRADQATKQKERKKEKHWKLCWMAASLCITHTGAHSSIASFVLFSVISAAKQFHHLQQRSWACSFLSLLFLDKRATASCTRDGELYARRACVCSIYLVQFIKRKEESLRRRQHDLSSFFFGIHLISLRKCGAKRPNNLIAALLVIFYLVFSI